jgi:hypothetical protein
VESGVDSCITEVEGAVGIEKTNAHLRVEESACTSYSNTSSDVRALLRPLNAAAGGTGWS